MQKIKSYYRVGGRHHSPNPEVNTEGKLSHQSEEEESYFNRCYVHHKNKLAQQSTCLDWKTRGLEFRNNNNILQCDWPNVRHTLM